MQHVVRKNTSDYAHKCDLKSVSSSLIQEYILITYLEVALLIGESTTLNRLVANNYGKNKNIILATYMLPATINYELPTHTLPTEKLNISTIPKMSLIHFFIRQSKLIEVE